MKNLLFTSVLLFTLKCSYAANNLHVFKTATESYVELNGDIDITAELFDDGWYPITALTGESFKLFNRNWGLDTMRSYIGLYKSGRIAIMGDTVFSLLDGMYADSIELIDANSKVSYKIEGTGNKKILKVQWKNLKVGYGPAGNYFNLQIWVYQEDGLIEFRYGDRSANNASGYTVASKGVYIGIWHSQDPNFYAVYEKINLKGTPPNIIVDSVRNAFVPNIQGIPASGTVYRFIPKTSKLSIAEKIEHLLSFYPNPANENIRIQATAELSGSSVQLYNLQGVLMDEMLLKEGENSVSSAHLGNGAYLLRFSGNGFTFSKTIIIRHD